MNQGEYCIANQHKIIDDTAFAYLNKETELFKVINVPMLEELDEI